MSTDQTNELIESRLKVFELEQRERTTAQVRATLDSEKTAIKQTIALLTKVIGYSATAIGILLGVLGWKSWSGAIESLEKKFESTLDQKISVTLPARTLKDMERIHLSAILHAFPAASRRADGNQPELAEKDLFDLTSEDWSVLSRAFSDPALNLQACKSAYATLRALASRNRFPPGSFVNALKQLASPPTTPAWLSTDSARMACILDSLVAVQDKTALPVFSRVLGEVSSSSEMIIAALTFASSYHSIELRESIEKLLARADLPKDVRLAALEALAAVAPDSKQVLGILEQFEKAKKLIPADVHTLLRLVVGAGTMPVDYLTQRSDSSARDNASRGLVAKCFKVLFGAKFVLYQNTLGTTGIATRYELAATQGEVIRSSLLTSYEFAQALQDATEDALSARSALQLFDVVSKFAVSDTITDTWRLLPKVGYFSGNIALANGSALRFADTADGVWLVPNRRDSSVSVFWVDNSGKTRRGVMIALPQNNVRGGFRLQRAPEFLSIPGGV